MIEVNSHDEAMVSEDHATGIDCEHAIYRLLQRVEWHLAGEASDSMVRRYLEREVGGRDGSEPDTRLVIHAQVNVLRELLHRRGDEDGLSLLFQIERKCC